LSGGRIVHCSRIKTLLAVSALTFAGPALAQSSGGQADPFYVDRKVQMIIPSSPGGGYDLYGRLFARHIGKHIPGSPTLVPANMPGASGVVAAQYIYAAAPQDGSVLGHFYATAIIDPVVNAQSRAKSIRTSLPSSAARPLSRRSAT
jgi:tripartite-type tricarboxylate transporter receptor subunit TctC